MEQFKETTKEFKVKIVNIPEEIAALLEVGFEYVCIIEGEPLFRTVKLRN